MQYLPKRIVGEAALGLPEVRTTYAENNTGGHMGPPLRFLFVAPGHLKKRIV